MQASTKRFVLLGALLLVCLGLFVSRSRTLVATTSRDESFNNPYVLKDWVTDAVFEASKQHIGYYLAINNVPGKALTISGAPRYGEDGSLSFEFKTDKSPNVYTATVQTASYGGGHSSSTVAVNEEDTAFAPADELYGASFEGFDTLVKRGLSTIQVYQIQSQLLRFNQSGPFVVRTGTFRQTTSDTIMKTVFDVTIKDTTYHVVNTSSGITDVHLIVSQGDKKVFDSGFVSIAN